MKKASGIHGYSVFLAAISMVVLTMLFFVEISYAGDDPDSGTKILQQKKSYRTVAVLPDKNTDSDGLSVEAHMEYGGKKLHTVTKSFDMTSDEGEPGGDDLTIELPYYGKWYFTSKYLKDGSIVKEEDTIVGVVAGQYRIAPLMSSIPVLIYSLKFLSGEITSRDGNGDPVPSVITLARSDQYDWNKLPENMFNNPYITTEDSYGSNSLYNVMPAVKAYVQDLVSLDPSSKFHFYMNDFHFDQALLPLVYGTGLADGRYSLTFITDGGGVSYNTFREVYGGIPDAAAKHERLVSEYRGMREEMRNGTPYSQFILYKYIYAILDVESDAEWWVIRKSAGDTFAIEDKSFLSTVIADDRVTSNYINGLLSGVVDRGKGEELKSLYKFQDEVFEEARANNKVPMMILGTSSGVEDADPIDEYVRIMMALYGDGYEYIYKGHPGNIPSSQRMAEMEELGMKCVDASIAAELFMFYNPDTVIAGYPSTTFLSAADPVLSKALFMLPREEACNSADDMWSGVAEYAGDADLYISRITRSGNNYFVGEVARNTSRGQNDRAMVNVRELDDRIPYMLSDDESTYYLIELSNDSEHDFAVWDSRGRNIRYLERDEDHDREAALMRARENAEKELRELASYASSNDEIRQKAEAVIGNARSELGKTTAAFSVTRIMAGARARIKALMGSGPGEGNSSKDDENDEDNGSKDDGKGIGEKLPGDGGNKVVTDPEKAGGAKGADAGAAVTARKKPNTLKVSFKNKIFKRITVKKKKASYKAVRIKKKGKGKTVYRIKFPDKKSKKVLSFNRKTGKLTIRRGVGPGKYRISITVKAKGNAGYEPSKAFRRVVTVRVKR